jgi:GTP cyclohydrolase I
MTPCFKTRRSKKWLVRDIHIASLCEHHMVPITGVVHIGYILAHGTIIGLSKLAKCFAQRLQVQEHLTRQISHSLQELLVPQGMAVACAWWCGTDISSLRTFGCRVWVRPPGGRDRKVIGNARVGHFLGYARMNSICVYIDEITKEVKELSNLCFDELFSDVSPPPPNTVVLRLLSNGHLPTTPPDEIMLTEDLLSVLFHPSLAPVNVSLPLNCEHPTAGLLLAHDESRDCAYISRLSPKSSAARAKLSKHVGAYLLQVNGIAFQHIDDVKRAFTQIQSSKGAVAQLVLDPEPIESAQCREGGELRLSSELLAAIHVVCSYAADPTQNTDCVADAFHRYYDETCSMSFAHSLSAASMGTDEERQLPRLTWARLKHYSMPW